MRDMKVIGIDPAPSKKSTICSDNGFEVPKDFIALKDYLSNEKKNKDVLICWDAPLSGPHLSADEKNLLATRPIETFFNSKKYKFKVPKGISVQGYAGCQHWTISRATLGLPCVGEYDCQNLPFELCTEGVPKGGHSVVEVHPAVAIWLWCKDSKAAPELWRYKGSKGTAEERSNTRKAMWKILKKDSLKQWADHDPQTDDELDALVAYALGRLWLDGEGDVIFLGDNKNGGFLVPNTKVIGGNSEIDITDAWGNFKGNDSKAK